MVTTRPAEGLADIRRVDPLAGDEWDRALSGLAASVFHSGPWARVLAATYGYTPLYHVSRRSGQMQGALPVMEVDSWLTGRRGIALPFTDSCEPLGSDQPTFESLFNALVRIGRERKWRYLELRGGERFLANHPEAESYYHHTLDLVADTESLFNQVASSVRRAIRKAEQSGLEILFSDDLKAVRSFYALLCKTRKRHGLPPQPFAFFENIHRHLLAEKKGCVALARFNGLPVAGAVFFHFGESVTYKFGASDEAFQHLRANNLVMWSAIKWHANRGFRLLDFGRTSLDNDGLRQFKLRWGTKERELRYFRFELPTGIFVSSTDKSTGWYNRFFRNLPTPFSRLVGATLYKHIA